MVAATTFPTEPVVLTGLLHRLDRDDAGGDRNDSETKQHHHRSRFLANAPVAEKALLQVANHHMDTALVERSFVRPNDKFLLLI